MENASKALLMAGGVLIAIIIIALLVKTFGSISAFQRQKTAEEEMARIEQFNKQFTKYQNQYVYGTEVITIINTIHNEQQKNYTITAKITFAGTYTYTRIVKKFGREITETVQIDSGESLNITNNAEGEDKGKLLGGSASDDAIIGLKSRAFKCTYIGYENGRVNEIRFEEKQYNNLT